MGKFKNIYKVLLYDKMEYNWTGPLAVDVIVFFSGNPVLLRRPGVDNFTDIIKIAINLFKTIFL